VTQPAPISRTSIYVAAGRAVGAREPDPAARNPDYLAEKLLGDPATLELDHPAVRALSRSYDDAMRDVEVVFNVRMMIIRTRFIDEALARAIANGATQVVILGAGFDSHAYRCQDLLANVKVFEVDRPVTQELKKQRVKEVLGTPPSNLTYVPVDFQQDNLLDVLTRHVRPPDRRRARVSARARPRPSRDVYGRRRGFCETVSDESRWHTGRRSGDCRGDGTDGRARPRGRAHLTRGSAADVSGADA